MPLTLTISADPNPVTTDENATLTVTRSGGEEVASSVVYSETMNHANFTEISTLEQVA